MVTNLAAKTGIEGEDILWVEKYRPKKLDDIVNQEEIVAALKEFVKNRNIPNLLFSGPPGTGKTTAALCIAYELYGDTWRTYTLELNASDERKIEVVRTKLKNYAKTMVVGEVPFKIIILDEADQMTSEAQHALRRMMEKFANISRFILICNYPSKIIEPIQSRCAVFRFKRLSNDAIKERLRFIAKNEHVDLKEDGLDALVEVSEGDLRKAINLLQSVAYFGVPVNKDLVYRTAGIVFPEHVNKLLQLAFAGKFEDARKMLITMLAEEGVSGVDLLRDIYAAIARNVIPIDPEDKIKLMELIGELDFRISQGATDYLQLSALLAIITDFGTKYRKSAR